MRNELRALRQAHALTQQQLAEALGVSRQTVISIEAGKYDPSLMLAFAIAKLFEVRIEDVFYPDK
jgi:putative transcriptional regulator